MTLSAAQFRTDYPEFAQTETDKIEAAIARALRRFSATVWGDNHDLVVGLCAATMLTDGPFGFRTRPSGGSGDRGAGYRRQLEDVILAHPRRGLVLSG